MKTTQLNKSALAGWVLAAGLLGLVLGSGFQNGAEKFAMVDLREVILKSKLSKDTTAKVEAARTVRINILKYINEQRVMSAVQCAQLRELELKDPKTDADKTKLDELKKTIVAQAKEYDTLVAGTTAPTETQRLRIIELNKYMQEASDMLTQYRDEFDQEFMVLREQAQNEAIDKAAAAARVVAKAKGYTIVYSSSAVVYAANDITADTTKEADK